MKGLQHSLLGLRVLRALQVLWMPRPDTTWWTLFKKGKRIINVNLGIKVNIYFEWENKLWKITLNPKIQALFLSL